MAVPRPDSAFDPRVVRSAGAGFGSGSGFDADSGSTQASVFGLVWRSAGAGPDSDADAGGADNEIHQTHRHATEAPVRPSGVEGGKEMCPPARCACPAAW